MSPGPRGAGIVLQPLLHGEGDGDRSPGRPPRPSTQRLRNLLERHAEEDALLDPSDYIHWLSVDDPELKDTTAKQIVYRELRKHRPHDANSGAGSPGRKPSERTKLLRERLDRDAEAGKLAKPKAYVLWLAKEEPDASRAALQQLVYRERARVEQQFS